MGGGVMPVLSEGTGSRKEIIGVVHLLALPGSPGWQGELDEVVQKCTCGMPKPWLRAASMR